MCSACFLSLLVRFLVIAFGLFLGVESVTSLFLFWFFSFCRAQDRQCFADILRAGKVNGSVGGFFRALVWGRSKRMQGEVDPIFGFPNSDAYFFLGFASISGNLLRMDENPASKKPNEVPV